MAHKVDWHGVYPALPTQFHDDFTLDLPSTQKHVEAMLEEGVHGLIMLGTIGENCSLSLDEKVKVLKATKEVCGDQVPLLNGIAEFTTANACETAKAAAAAGVDGFMVMPGMSGVELLSAIKNIEIAKKSKCIVLSNQGESEDIDAAKAAGADGYIIKAESIPSEVVNKVHTIMTS